MTYETRSAAHLPAAVAGGVSARQLHCQRIASLLLKTDKAAGPLLGVAWCGCRVRLLVHGSPTLLAELDSHRGLHACSPQCICRRVGAIGSHKPASRKGDQVCDRGRHHKHPLQWGITGLCLVQQWRKKQRVHGLALMPQHDCLATHLLQCQAVTLICCRFPTRPRSYAIQSPRCWAVTAQAAAHLPGCACKPSPPGTHPSCGAAAASPRQPGAQPQLCTQRPQPAACGPAQSPGHQAQLV